MKNFLIIIVFFLSTFSILAKAEDSTKGELKVTLQPSVISLDPGGIQDSQSWVVSRQVNCQLVRSQGSIFVLDAAESIKYITPLKIILKISNKAKFHDGTLVTAEDVLYPLHFKMRFLTINLTANLKRSSLKKTRNTASIPAFFFNQNVSTSCNLDVKISHLE